MIAWWFGEWEEGTFDVEPGSMENDVGDLSVLKERLDSWLDRNREELAAPPQYERVHETESHIPVRPLYTPLDLADAGFDYLRDLGFPGEPPYTRGAFAPMYRSQPWRFTQYAGQSTAEETNQLYREHIQAGLTSIQVAFDLPTQLGYDSDHPKALGEVGKSGVPVKSLRDWEGIFQGIDLGSVYVFSVANAQAAIILAMHQLLAEKQGVPLGVLQGGIHNDILKEYFARGNFIFPPEQSVRLVADTMLYCAEQLPSYDARLMCSIHIGESGATRIHEVAFALGNSIAYLDHIKARGIDVGEVLRNGLFCTTYCNHTDFFEEIAKIRALRRLWGRIVRERYGIIDPRAQQLRINASQTGSVLTKQQPLNNIVRTTLSTLIGALAGAQSVDPRTFDEGWGIASQEAELLSLRTNQIVAYETRIVNTADPLGGSYFVESLTGELEQRIWEELERIDEQGGMVRAIEAGYPQQIIARDAYERQIAIDEGRTIRVGLNSFIESEEGRTVRTYKAGPEIAEQHVRDLEHLRQERSSSEVQRCLEQIRRVAAREPKGRQDNLMPPIVAAVAALATTQEICDALRDVWGEYKGSQVF